MKQQYIEMTLPKTFKPNSNVKIIIKLKAIIITQHMKLLNRGMLYAIDNVLYLSCVILYFILT